MHVFVEIFSLAAIKSLIIGIPESVGLLLFGIGLVFTAAMIRRRLSVRHVEGETFEEEV